MARTVVTIVGMADRLSGTSKKTGKPYDMCEVAVTFVNQWGSNSVAVATLDGAVLDKCGVQIGDRYDAVVNQFNGRAYVELIEAVF